MKGKRQLNDQERQAYLDGFDTKPPTEDEVIE